MHTQPLYVEDSYLKTFTATVTRTGPRFVVLDRTAFYPEGGGQPSDQGTIQAGSRTLNVVKAMKRGDQIFHYLDGDIPEGTQVTGTLDWSRRFRHMRLHSGEHLLTGLLEQAGSGPKVFSSFTQLDFKPSDLTQETLDNVAERFNEVIDMDLPVEAYHVDREELDVGDDARKQSFLSKIPGDVHRLRMIRIGGHALTFCMGTHVGRTGEIGRLKETRLEPKKKRRKIVYFTL